MTSQLPSSLTSYLPPGDGLLPKWLLFISVVSLANSIQSYTSLAGTREVYAGGTTTTTNPSGTSTTSPSSSLPSGIPTATLRSSPTIHPSPVTPLSARTFGTWTALSAIIRLYAAYHISSPQIYELALWTFGIAGAHFLSEWLVFGTAKWGRGLAGPIFVALGTGTWKGVQWGWYVK